MALTKNKKNEVVKEVSDLLDASQMTVLARYKGIEVKKLQSLRRDAKENGTKVKVIKNRLVIQALKNSAKYKDTDTSSLEGMILYAFNNEDEVAPAQILNTFSKTNPSLEFIGAINGEGNFISADEVKALAVLPNKHQLIAGVVNILNSPIKNISSGLSNNLSGILSGLEAKANN